MGDLSETEENKAYTAEAKVTRRWEAEMGVPQPQAMECLELSEVRGSKEGFSPRAT